MVVFRVDQSAARIVSDMVRKNSGLGFGSLCLYAETRTYCCVMYAASFVQSILPIAVKKQEIVIRGVESQDK